MTKEDMERVEDLLMEVRSVELNIEGCRKILSEARLRLRNASEVFYFQTLLSFMTIPEGNRNIKSDIVARNRKKGGI
jgi:hypothetical protein